jgi:hypothetical protein
MMNLYRVYCEENGWLEIISESIPTVCPIDSGDTLRAGSAVVVEQDIKTNEEGYYTELSLENYKFLKNNTIDNRTGELINLGYNFATKQFSLSANAQTNILALDHTKDDPALIYPIEYNTIDDMDSFSIPDSTTLHNMYLTALTTKKGVIDSGTALKDSVRLATDEAGVDAVIDNR